MALLCYSWGLEVFRRKANGALAASDFAILLGPGMELFSDILQKRGYMACMRDGGRECECGCFDFLWLRA